MTVSGWVPNFHTKPYIHVHMYIYILCIYFVYIVYTSIYILCINVYMYVYIYVYTFTENCRMAIAFTRQDTAGTAESNCSGQACGSSHKKSTEVEGLSNGYVKSLGI
jgi:type IV secretory pathway VirB3-like protein